MVQGGHLIGNRRLLHELPGFLAHGAAARLGCCLAARAYLGFGLSNHANWGFARDRSFDQGRLDLLGLAHVLFDVHDEALVASFGACVHVLYDSLGPLGFVLDDILKSPAFHLGAEVHDVSSMCLE